mmetsp:Transcript_45856/g.143473  ORF Transcript_45856/g.143473 Transcript_45856/m.143473 type:complete len:217 (-) Transcript_45856:1021-1671(-)
MAFELLLGRGIQGGGSVKRRLKEHEAALRAALPADVVKQQQKQQNRPDSSGFSRRRPRYVRLNTLHQSDANALVELRELMNSAPGAEEKSKGKGKGKGRGKSKDEGKSKHAQQEGALADAVDTILDAHVPHLLALAPAEDVSLARTLTLVPNPRPSEYPTRAKNPKGGQAQLCGRAAETRDVRARYRWRRCAAGQGLLLLGAGAARRRLGLGGCRR